MSSVLFGRDPLETNKANTTHKQNTGKNAFSRRHGKLEDASTRLFKADWKSKSRLSSRIAEPEHDEIQKKSITGNN